MPIEFVKGLPRGGKSFYALMRLVDEVCEISPRVVVTNLFIRNTHLADVVAKRLQIPYSLALLRVNSLVYHLPFDELKNFYRRRGFGRYLSPKEDFSINGRSSPVPAYNKSDFEEWACFYILDEIHVVYDVNGYRDEGEQVSYYLSQHGKLGECPFDHVIVISQHPEQVSKKFKLLIQDWHVLRNRYMDKMGLFKLGACFIRKRYFNEPKLSSVAVEVESFKFNKELADCYDTLAGVGVRGRGSPRIAHAKGLPTWTLWGAGLAAVVLLFLAVAGIPRLVVGAFASSTTQAANTLGNGVASAGQPSASSVAPGATAHLVAHGASAPDPVVSSAWPVRVDYPARAVVMSDGARMPLSDCGGYVRRGRWAIVAGFRIPVDGD